MQVAVLEAAGRLRHRQAHRRLPRQQVHICMRMGMMRIICSMLADAKLQSLLTQMEKSRRSCKLFLLEHPFAAVSQHSRA